ncbi:Co2+/Mg2+ efflux protein ApaG [Pulveribacter suum]|uniref:Protein ApaG n=1 Tax=Pulveribacter suum TaxID=2116657 RepID=A0A2P1NHE9_9BURK|nr:Co2+/Mg2+ efflux protein ApaG [Pulveribacter suum]AVP56483.1 Co2+/Mg2+ efflux protein ApaG [Pulveribacter suum]
MSTYQFKAEVQPEYLPGQSAPERGVHSFAYTITVTNTGSAAAQLIARHWVITDAGGHVEEVKGLGVVGQQPLLRPGESFQYTSGCRLRTASGTMHGSYFCVAEDGERFECPVPLFVLEAAPPGGAGAGGSDLPPQGRVLH